MLNNISHQNNRYDLSKDYGIGFTDNGIEFYFDKDDYEKIKSYHWCINKNGYVYAKFTKDGVQKQIYLHRLVLNVIDKPNLTIFHISQNRFDNRKSQLIIPSLISRNKIGIMNYEDIKAYNPLDINGYVAYYIPNHHLANKSGIVYEHELIAEIMLQRELKRGEVVHHEDRNRKNNNIKNLKVFKTNSDHAAYHQGCKIKIENDTYIALKNDLICPECGGKKSYNSKLCIKCYNNISLEKFKIYYPNNTVNR